MKIAIIGASGTGKTTLARALSEEFSLPLIREQARLVMAEFGMELKEIRKDPNLLLRFQDRVLEMQIKSELEHPDGFVSDRSVFDNLTLFLRHCTFTEAELFAYQQKVMYHYRRHPYDLLLFLRPGEFPLVDDGVRTPDPNYQWQIDGMILSLLKLLFVEYFEPHGSLKQRTEQVKNILREKKLLGG